MDDTPELHLPQHKALEMFHGAVEVRPAELVPEDDAAAFIDRDDCVVALANCFRAREAAREALLDEMNRAIATGAGVRMDALSPPSSAVDGATREIAAEWIPRLRAMRVFAEPGFERLAEMLLEDDLPLRTALELCTLIPARPPFVFSKFGVLFDLGTPRPTIMRTVRMIVLPDGVRGVYARVVGKRASRASRDPRMRRLFCL